MCWGGLWNETKSPKSPGFFFISEIARGFLTSCIAVQIKNILPFSGVYFLANNIVEINLPVSPKGLLKNPT